DNKTLAAIYKEWLAQPAPAPEIPEAREGAGTLQERLREQLRRVLGLAKRPAAPRVSVQSRASRGDVLMRQLILETEPGIRVPAFEVKRRGAEPAGVVL